jgi:hypothetical protein
VKRVLKWAASEQLVPVSVFQALATVTGLQAGRTDAEEREAVKPRFHCRRQGVRNRQRQLPDPETGELTPLGKRIITDFWTYTELSLPAPA